MSELRKEPQDAFPEDLARMVAWVSSYVSPGSRVLEIGCGDGALIETVAAAVACEAVGADPNGASSSVVRAQTFESLDEAPFDVLVASVSLHHLADRGAAVDALRRLSHPGTTFLVREFDWTDIDERTNRWWFQQALLIQPPEFGSHQHSHHEHGHVQHADHQHGANNHALPAGFEEYHQQWLHQMQGHVSTWDEVKSILGEAGFVTKSERKTAWMFRYLLSDQHRIEEERLAAEGRINLVGRCWEGQRA
jgi:cyclopropane fatty-acyl-phospholipid synthase-like methyltransferase